MTSRKARITKRTVDAVAKPETGEARLWDIDIRGFFLRVYPTGRRVYALKYRLGPRQRIFTIGEHGSPFTPETARDAADKALRRVKDGEDPAIEKKAEREALTVTQLIARYLEEGPATKPAKRESSWAIDRANLHRHIRPLLGRKVANHVTKAEAAKAIRDIVKGVTAIDEKSENARGRIIVSGGEATAHRTRATAAAMFAWGVEHGYVKSNPFASMRLSTPATRERFLTRDEAGKLIDAIARLEAAKTINPAFGDAVRLLLLTGARKTEILGLRWAEVDFERKRLLLPQARTKTGGQNGERRIVLSPPALEILARRLQEAKEGAEFVLPSTKTGGPVVGLRKAFLAACAAAGLDDLRVHDLRHSFASFAVADGASLFLVGKLLGHATSRTAERYAHLSGDPLDAVAAAVAKNLSKPPRKASDNVSSLKGA